jgi:hypothetical protein
VGWAVLHLALGLVLNASLPRVAAAADPAAADAEAAPDAAALAVQAAAPDAAADGATATATTTAPHAAMPASASLLSAAEQRIAAWILASVFALTWFISTAMAAHLPGLLQAGGVSLSAAVAVGALVGPAQVAGRLLEFGLLRRLHPLLSARLAALAHPIGAGALLLVGAPAAFVFALLHGAGNGILTIAKGTLPLALFGAQGYGARQGLLMMPSRVAQACAPWLFGLGLERWGMNMLYGSAALGLLAFAALQALPYRAPAGAR